MKFSIDKKDILSALRGVAMIVERRNTNAILSNVKISVNGETLTIIATDSEIEAIQKIGIKSDSDGVTTVNAGMQAIS